MTNTGGNLGTAQCLYMLGRVAENIVLPFVSSGTGHVGTSGTRGVQIGAGVTTTLFGTAASRLVNPGAALGQVARNVTGDGYAVATSEAGQFADAALLSYRMLRESLAFLFVPIEYLNGFGETDQSSKKFRDGHAAFSDDISAILKSATAENWSGDSAGKYTDQNAFQQKRVEAMACADNRLADLLDTQASAVESGREQLAAVRLAVTGGLVVATGLLALYLNTLKSALLDITAFERARAYANALIWFTYFLLAGLTANAIYVLTTLGIQGTETKNRIKNVIGDNYQWIVDDWHNNAPPSGAFGGRPPVVESTAVSGFAGLAERLPGAADNSDSDAGSSDRAGAAVDAPLRVAAVHTPHPSGQRPQAPWAINGGAQPRQPASLARQSAEWPDQDPASAAPATQESTPPVGAAPAAPTVNGTNRPLPG